MPASSFVNSRAAPRSSAARRSSSVNSTTPARRSGSLTAHGSRVRLESSLHSLGVEQLDVLEGVGDTKSVRENTIGFIGDRPALSKVVRPDTLAGIELVRNV